MDKNQVKAAAYRINEQMRYGYLDIDIIDIGPTSTIEFEIVKQALSDWVEKHAEEYDLYSEEDGS